MLPDAVTVVILTLRYFVLFHNALSWFVAVSERYGEREGERKEREKVYASEQ
jgi:hypothetical protein